MIPALSNHLWQSTLFALAAGLLAAALRKNGAEVRHRIWVIASLKFLVPFALLVNLGTTWTWTPPSTPAGAPSTIETVSIVADQIAQPFNEVFPSAAAVSQAPAWPAALIVVMAVWACGIVAILTARVRSWRRIRAAVRTSVPIALDVPVSVRASAGVLEPGVVGLWRPVLLVPAGIEDTLTPAQMHAVLLHELCHVRRRDNLTSAMHMIVESVFWFHPLVWVIGAKLVDERERACDEHVLRVCGDPQVYAESILSVCKAYVESPLACVSGVGGSDLRKRIAAILANHAGLRLSVPRKLALAVAALLAIVLPLAAGSIAVPLIEAHAAQTAVPRKFDVASVKPCDPGSAIPGPGRGNSPGNQASPGYLNLSCLTLRQLVSRAYLYNPEDHLRNRKWEEQFVPGFPAFIRGGPSWLNTDRFTIEARAEGVTEAKILSGPLLRALLEDRFQVKTHRATEERSMWALSVDKAGLKIKPMPAGECTVREPGKPLQPDANNLMPCGASSGDGWGTSQAHGVILGDTTLASQRFVDELWNILMQPVIDRTGLSGRYSFAFNFTPDENTPGVNGQCGGSPECKAALAARGRSDERPATFKSNATIFKAIEELGLKLEQVKVPAEYLVIDSAERPTPNAPLPTRAAGAGR